MAFANDQQLGDLLPTIFEHGESSYQDELDRAEADVVRKIKIEWFNKRSSSNTFDQTKLNESQWELATLYRALGFYIMPKLSQWRPESDSFREQIEFYQARFAEEMADQFGVGIEYDQDSSGTIDSDEVYENIQTRMYR